MKKLQQGFTLGEIMIVVAIIGILAAVAIPNFVKNRNESQRKACISNMRQISTAGENYLTANNMDGSALNDNGWKDALCGTDNYIKVVPSCPSGGAYTIAFANEVLSVTCDKADLLKHYLPENAPAGSSSTAEPSNP